MSRLRLPFIRRILVRFFTILFRGDRKLRRLYLEYDTEHLFNKSYVVISYRFRNAICYRFANHWTTENELKIFDLENFENDFTLIVYGFFQSVRYKISLIPQLELNSKQFQKEIHISTALDIPNRQHFTLPDPTFTRVNVKFAGTNLRPMYYLKFELKPYNQNDHI